MKIMKHLKLKHICMSLNMLGTRDDHVSFIKIWRMVLQSFWHMINYYWEAWQWEAPIVIANTYKHTVDCLLLYLLIARGFAMSSKAISYMYIFMEIAWSAHVFVVLCQNPANGIGESQPHEVECGGIKNPKFAVITGDGTYSVQKFDLVYWANTIFIFYTLYISSLPHMGHEHGI